MQNKPIFWDNIASLDATGACLFEEILRIPIEEKYKFSKCCPRQVCLMLSTAQPSISEAKIWILSEAKSYI